MNDSKFKRVMRWVLNERYQNTPDEPDIDPGAHLGQWFLPRRRLDVPPHVDEKDTELEVKLWDALKDHYKVNYPQKLEAIWPELKRLHDMGLYTEFLQPLQVPAYRGMAADNPEGVASILGLGLDEVKNAQAGVIQVIEGPGVYEPQGKKISSWTQKPSVASYFTGPSTVWASVILRAMPGQENNFMINVDRMPDDFKVLYEFGSEEEIISYGPVKWDKAVWFKRSEEQSGEDVLMQIFDMVETITLI